MERYLAKQPHNATMDTKAHTKRFQELLQRGAAKDEVRRALDFASQKVSWTALGRSCSVMAPGPLKEKGDAFGCSQSLLCGGSLGQMDLHADAVKTMDVGRISFFLHEYQTIQALKKAVGTIIINSSLWSGESFAGLRRVNKDAEVHTMCLLAYWLQTPEILDACADLAFDFQSVGTGTQQAIFTLHLLDDEDKQRNIAGISGWRRLLLYVDLADSMMSEGRVVAGETEADRLLNLLQQEKIDMGNINVDTMKRYLALGRRCQAPLIQDVLAKWEALSKRECLADQISTLRLVFGATDSDAELAYILHVLMLQQRCGIRCDLKIPKSRNELRTPANIAKGILIRQRIFTHLEHTFTQFRELIIGFSGDECYKDLFGIDEHGMKVQEAVEDAEDDDCKEPSPGDISSYASRQVLLTFLKGLVKNVYEKTICGMSKTTAAHRLDLTSEAAAPIRKVIDQISASYNVDFPPTTGPNPVVVTYGTDTDAALTVVVKDEPLTMSEYNGQLEQYNKTVTEFENNKVDYLLGSKIVTVVDDMQDTAKLKRKLMNINLLADKRRKVFVHDELCAKPLDWDHLGKNHKSMFTPLKQTMADETLDVLVEVYSAFRTEDDTKTSDDTIVVIMPGAPPNSPVNKNVQTTYAKMGKVAPKLQPPKIGVIEVRHGDILARTKSRVAFQGSYQNNIMFTRQKKGPYTRMNMANLGGDNFSTDGKCR